MENLDQDRSANPLSRSTFTDEVSQFYSGDFKTMFLTFFKDPINGISTIFRNASDKSFTHSLILYGSVAALYLVGAFLLMGPMREYMTLGGYLRIALMPVLIMFIISALSFGVKSLTGKVDFKAELLTGALCGIPLGLMIPSLLVARVLGSDGNAMAVLTNPLAGGTIIMLFALYMFMMLVNVFQQSLKSAKTNETLAWYVSPLCIALAFYLATKVSTILF
jgi:hypothetical protein